MRGRPRTSAAAWRLTGYANALWGAVLIRRGPDLWSAVAARPPDDVERAAIRVLGVRHLSQGAFEAALPGRLPRTMIAIDLLHAASMVALARTSSARRRPALVSAAVATSSAVLLWLARRGAAPRAS